MRIIKAQLNTISVILFTGILVQAAVEIKTQFTGSVKTKIATETHFRHSLNCYVEKKGTETTAFPDQILSLIGGAQALSSTGQVTWVSDLYSPFSRRIRTLALTASVDETPIQTKIGLQLNDAYQYQVEMYGRNDCQHWNGITAPSDASTGGFIDITYKVPSDVWLLSIERGEFNGLFTIKALPHIEGSLNSKDEILRNKQSYVWVTPNTSIVLHLNFPQQVLGNLELLNSAIVIKPIGDSEINLKNIENSAKVFNQTPKNGEMFINSVLALSRNPEVFQKTLATIDIKTAATLSEILNKISKSVIKDPQLGLPIKTAAAMGAFELSYGILKDLAGYCKEVAIE